jgi:hypothetical protein
MTVGPAALPLLRRHASSELKLAHATVATADRGQNTFDVTNATNKLQHNQQPQRPPQILIHNEHNDPPPPVRQTRKPSPGLAARLKALGFGKDTTRRQKPNEVATTDNIGRIPEDHIRTLDSLHRANSTKSVIQRRGRTWSGASGRPAPQIVGSAETGFTVVDPAQEAQQSIPSSPIAVIPDNRVLEVQSRREASPAVEPQEAAMSYQNERSVDQQKYRLPDHINGNGTKATPATRLAHMDRDNKPPPAMLEKELPAEPEAPADFTSEVQSYFNPFGLQRSGSIYTLSRVSFANQLAQLTSLQLPDAGSLASRVSAIPTSQAAARALVSAAEQIRNWISKAFEVLGGLDADDDVEWAAAGGREGLEDVDNAIARFEQLINVYVSAIEQLQGRDDIATVPPTELKTVVTQVEIILVEWEKIKKTLTDVKGQVGVAIEWEELWNVVLGDIGYEMDILSRLVFEMEEKRHRSLIAEASEEGIDLKDLETIAEETPPSKSQINARNRFSVTAAFPMSPNSPQTSSMTQDDSTLLALFARMQPLRASLDFLPMRLSTFHARAEATFPTACEELETRREGLEASWKSLEKDAESLRKELGEDRWVLVFRGAGRQANKMYESVERSVSKLREAIDAGGHLNNPSAMGKKIESYESKKTHYGPAIERVLAIIEKGVSDRLTVNGEIVRLHSDMQGKWDSLKEQMFQLDKMLETLQADKRNQQLRDSISSLMSNDRSTLDSLDTPGSSPASSVIMSNLQQGTDPTTPGKSAKQRSHLPQPGGRRTSSTLPRKGLTPRVSVYGAFSGRASPSPISRENSSTPTGNRLPRPSLLPASLANRPRWNSSVKTDDGLTGNNFKPLSLTTPSPHARSALPQSNHSVSGHGSSSSVSKIPLRRSVGPDGQPNSSPIGPSTSSRFPSTPAIDTTPSRPRITQTLAYYDRTASPSPSGGPRQIMSSPPTRLQSQASSSNITNPRRLSVQPTNSAARTLSRRISLQPMDLNPQKEQENPSDRQPVARAMSSMATSRRTSLLPQPRGRKDSSVTGRESPQAIAGAAIAMRRNSSQVSQGSTDSKGSSNKPKWR